MPSDDKIPLSATAFAASEEAAYLRRKWRDRPFDPATGLGAAELMEKLPALVDEWRRDASWQVVKAKAFASWVGLKGAGPILFALCPVVAGLDGATEIFNIVFFISLLSLILQGMTLSPSSRWLGLSYEADPEVETFGMEIPEEMGMLRDHTVTEDDLQNGETLRDLHLPHGIRVMMVKRDGKFLVPHGSMQLQEGDHLVIIMGDTDD